MSTPAMFGSDKPMPASYQDPASRHPFRYALLVAGVLLGATGLLGILLAVFAPSALQTALKEGWQRFAHIDTPRIGIYLAVVLGVFLMEIPVLGWRRSSLGKLAAWSPTARTDLLIAFIHTVGWSPILMTVVSGGAMWGVKRIAESYCSFGLIQGIQPVWIQFLIVFLVTDFLDYWYHRISHEVEFLWEAHKYHHAATEFTILTGDRVHALEDAFHHLVAIFPLTILGTPVKIYLGVRIVMAVIELLQHSTVPWTYGWAGRWVIFSPVGHRIHHSPHPEHWDKNFGNILVIWDRLFRTWYGGRITNEIIDVSENPYHRRGVVVEYLLCIAWYAQALTNSLKTGQWRAIHRRGPDRIDSIDLTAHPAPARSSGVRPHQG